MRRALLLTTLLVLSGGGTAQADGIRYVGPHPIAPKVHAGMCHIEGPHIHTYAPHKPLLYVQVDGDWSFIGDPVEFEPAAPKQLYYGHHPIFWTPDYEEGEVEVEHFCYISGPHYHWYAPPASIEFKVKGGAHWYVGPVPKWYRKRRIAHRDLDRYYATVQVERPVIEVEPPAGFIGLVVDAHPGRAVVHGHVGADVRVAPPRVRVNIPVPSLNISIGGGGAVQHHHHVVGGPRYRVKHHGPGKHKRKLKIKGGGGKVKIKVKGRH